MDKKTVTLVAESIYSRADVFVSDNTELSRSAVKNLITVGKILKNGNTCKASTPVDIGDVFIVEIPQNQPLTAAAQDIDIDIVYQDSYIAVINKRQGMTVHPAAGSPDKTLVNALLYHIKDLSGINGVLRPGIVHRLDKDTSGLIVIAKCDSAHISLSAQIADKSCRRIYYALARGVMKSDSGIISEPIARSHKDRKKMAVVFGGRAAVTHYKVIKRFDKYTFVRLELKTGRTHQIRVHLAHIGHPIVCDGVYNRNKCEFAAEGQLLHSQTLIFNHPHTGKTVSFHAPLPDYFVNILKKI